jgi:dolichol-phosphate mannosyltransferase
VLSEARVSKVGENNSLTVVIPAFDEEANLRWLIPEVLKELRNLRSVESKILVVMRADESDSSLSGVRSLGASAIRRVGDNSFGSAIKTGIASSLNSTTHILFMDADGSHSPNTILKLWVTAIDTNADVVIASRYTEGGSTSNSFLQIQMSRILNLIYALVLGINVKDVSTNFKIYKTSIFLGIVLKCKNYDIVEEMLLKTSRRNGPLKIIEIPDHFEKRKFGESKRKLTLFIASYILTLFKLRFSKSS